jgi:HSP20 family molecular chaperone IbpA
MRKDFFRLRPSDDTNAGRRGSSGSDSTELSNMYYNKPDGSQLFRVTFDVSQFNPSEVEVRTEQQRLIVYAKHEEKREYFFSLIVCCRL